MSNKQSMGSLPSWITRRVDLLGFEEDWLRKPIPALGNQSIIQAYLARDFERIIRVFARNADALGKEDPYLYNFTDDELRELKEAHE